jgi:nucleoid-associated protein YgaU
MQEETANRDRGGTLRHQEALKMKNRAGWLALIVLVIASLLMVFFVLPRINQGSKPLGDAINAAGDAVQDAVNEPKPAKPGDTATPKDATKPSGQAAAPTPAVNGAAAGGTEQASKTGRPVPAADAAKPTPAFDVLRVEPDGSTVIAGKAEPNSTLEVTDGNSVVAKVQVGPSGDFAIVLDTPLPPGDHQLVLKATGKDGKSVVSEETATISIPADKNSGKLLAMVTTPGKASRLIETPTPAPTQAPTPALAAGSNELASTPPPGMAPEGVVTPAPATGMAPAAPVGSSELQITAVELEGNKIFIAGIARSGTSVRGLADGKEIGRAQPSSNRHFVIEGTADLPVGDHTITVESLNAAGQALVRVEVPFNRPEGDMVAAVAMPLNGAVTSAITALDGGIFDRLRADMVRAFNLLQRLYAEGKLPSVEQMTAARSGTSIALKSLSEYRLPAGAPPAARMLAETTTREAGTAVVALDKLPADVAAVGTALKDIRGLIARALGPVMSQQMDGAEVVADAAADANGLKTFQQAPLTQSDRGAVIIRRGDTLWQISRRVYGQGVRYTTIYLANEDQINNPDVIQPGQIFGVPEEFRPDAEELHRQRLLRRKS